MHGLSKGFRDSRPDLQTKECEVIMKFCCQQKRTAIRHVCFTKLIPSASLKFFFVEAIIRGMNWQVAASFQKSLPAMKCKASH